MQEFGRVLAARVSGQAGLVTRAQLTKEGWSPAAIRWQLESGRWRLMHRGIYLTTPGRYDWEVRSVAALLAVGTPSCLAGSSAGEAWGLIPKPDAGEPGQPGESGQPGHPGYSGRAGHALVEVLVPTGRNGKPLTGVTVRRTRHFEQHAHPTEWPHRTTIEHTIFDLSLGRGVDRCIAMMAKGCQLQLTNEQSLAATLSTRPTQPHRQILFEALGLIGEGAESAAEVRFIRDVELAHGLPTGVRQEPGPGARTRDSEYADWGVIVEIDGRLGHVGWSNQQTAGRRDRKAARNGVLTVRAGWPDVAATPCELAADLGDIFRARGWLGQPQPCGRSECDLATRAA